MQRNELEQKLIEKALKDESFRKHLIDNPKAAIEGEWGIKLPESTIIKVLEEDLQTVYFVLPAQGRMTGNQELSESDLESVAGGTYTTVGAEVSCNARPIPVEC